MELEEKQVRVKLRTGDNERYVLSVARTGLILSTTKNIDKAKFLSKMEVDAMSNFAQRYNEKEALRPKDKLHLTAVD